MLANALQAKVTLLFGFVRAQGWGLGSWFHTWPPEPGSLAQHQLPSEVAIFWRSPLMHGPESFLSLSSLILQQGRATGPLPCKQC